MQPRCLYILKERKKKVSRKIGLPIYRVEKARRATRRVDEDQAGGIRAARWLKTAKWIRDAVSSFEGNCRHANKM